MKIKIELEREDFNAMHDVILETKGYNPTDEQIQEIWNSLPEDIKGTALQWGCDDTVFRDNLYVYLSDE